MYIDPKIPKKKQFWSWINERDTFPNIFLIKKYNDINLKKKDIRMEVALKVFTKLKHLPSNILTQNIKKNYLKMSQNQLM